MKFYVAIIVAIVIVVAASGFYVYYESQSNQEQPATGSHIYLGAVYAGQPKSVDYVSANVNFNSGPNLKDTIYYDVLSAWDSNMSYDQIGIASLYGHFYSTYSYTTTVNGTITYHYKKTGWFPISEGNHSLSMLADGGYVTFTFDNSSYVANTGGSNFTMSSNERIGNHSYAGLTVYEEIYGFNTTLPGISYNFSDVRFGTAGFPSGYVTNWAKFSHNISTNMTSYVYMKLDVVNIYNTHSLILTVEVQNLASPASLSVSDMNVTIPGSGQYEFNLIRGNYTIYLSYSNQTKSYRIFLTTDTSYLLRA